VPARFDCPEADLLQTPFGSALAPAQEERFERHVESCPACQEQLGGTEAFGSDFLRLARQFGDPTVAPADPTLTQVLERLHGVKSPLRPNSEFIDLYFLDSADRPDLLGTLGRYEIQQVLGQGGMGIVLKAFDPALRRLVALKVLAPGLAGSPTARERFKREARAAAAVRHDHLVAVHGVHEAQGLPYLVMQYVAGESLQARLDRAGPLDVEEVVRIGREAAEGLAAAHARGLIHRDVKPANILLEDGFDRVKITDFGLARAAADVPLTQHGVVAGTPEYMAPEQARGEPVDHRADLFSLGSVLYAMCTGRPPFAGDTPLGVLRGVSDDAPPPVRARNVDVPPWLDQLIGRLLAKNPNDRIQSAADVASLLGTSPSCPPQEGPILLAELHTPSVRLLPRTGRRQVPLSLLTSGRGSVLLGLALAVIGCFLVNAAFAPDGAAPHEPERVLARLTELRARVQRDEQRPGRPVVAIVFKDTPPELMPSQECRVGEVTDDDLKEFAAFSQLRNLDLTDARKVTGSGLKSLTGLKQLRSLTLGRTAMTDAAIKDVAAFDQLQGLGLEETTVTDAGLREIAGLTHLVYLNIGGTGVTDTGLKALARMTQLRTLCLYHTAVSDAGLKELLPLTQLQTLMIADTAVTGDGLKRLAPLEQLTNVDRGTSVSREFHERRARPVPPDAPPAGVPRSARGRGWLAAAGIIAVLLALPVVVAWWLVRRSRRASDGRVASADCAAFACSGCGKAMKAKAESVGKRCTCPHCGAQMIVPSAVTQPGPASGGRRPLMPVLFFAALALGAGLLALGLLGGGTETDAQVGGDPGARPEAAIDEQVLALAFTPDGKKLVTAGARETSPGQFMVWDVASRKELVRVRGIPGIRGVAVSPDGQTVACGVFGGVLTLRDVNAGETRAEATGHDIGVNSVAFSRDGSFLLTAGLDRVVKLWDVKGLRERRAFHGHGDMVYSVAWFEDGQSFVSGGQDRTARVWDVTTGKERFRLGGHASPIETVAVSPGDRLVATASWDRTIKLWDAVTGNELASLPGHDGGVLGLAFSPDGKFLASSTDRGTVYLWDVAARNLVGTCQRHPERVWSLAFSPDGSLVASGGSDRVARLWDVAAGRDVATLSTVGADAAPAGREVRAAGTNWLAAVGVAVVLAALSGFGAWRLAGSAARRARHT
jgi:hypothetical protein